MLVPLRVVCSGTTGTWGSNMTEIVRFVDTVSYTEADQADFNKSMMRPQGVLMDSSYGPLSVSAIGSMNVRVSAGEAFIQGFQYRNDANKDIPIDSNSSGSTRIDTIVLRLDRSANTITAVAKKGTPGAGAPTLTQVAGGTWEFPLYNVTIVNGAGTITSGNLADVRVYSRWPVTALSDSLASDTELAAEATARTNADNTLQTNINNEATTRGNADTTLQTNITNETNARVSADTTLQTNINNEATTRAAADTNEATIRANNDNAEAAARANADNALDARLDVLEAPPKIFASGYIAGSTGAIVTQYNVTSCVRNSTGLYTITTTGGPAHQFFLTIGSPHFEGRVFRISPSAANTILVSIFNDSSGALQDSDFSFIALS